MESITSLVGNLKADLSDKYPSLASLQIVTGSAFSWNYKQNTIYYSPADPQCNIYLLHEFAHALLAHQSYSRDIELVAMERDAWQQAQQLSSQYDIDISEDLIKDALDTYRDWLHVRSTCPNCKSTGIQVAKFAYECLSCRQKWSVNEAKTCALRRYKQ